MAKKQQISTIVARVMVWGWFIAAWAIGYTGGSQFEFVHVAFAAGKVYYVSATGNDGAAGTLDAPWKTIHKGVKAAGPGDTVLVRAGSYAEEVSIEKSGTPDAYITLKNYPGEVPILENNGRLANGISGSGSYIQIEGLVVRNFLNRGISFDGSKGLTVRYCVVDGNGEVGIHSSTSPLLLEYNIASRNGWRPPAWSSGIDVWNVSGPHNVVRGNISFNNVDESSHHSDGNGFILDVSYGTGGCLFENNIAFNNGGNGITVTHSSNATIIGNTLYQNSRDSRVEGPGEVSIGGSSSFVNILLRNNVGQAAPGIEGVTTWDGSVSSNQMDHNYWVSGTGTTEPQFVDPENADFRLKSSSPLIDKAVSTGTIGHDIGFDPKAIKREENQRYAWWHHAPNIDYIIQQKGLANCFHPVPRPANAPDIGAYDFRDVTTISPPAAPQNLRVREIQR